MLEGAYNFRDLGGLPTVDGRRTRNGRLFRSDSLQELTEADVARLIDELDITFVIDLRQAIEAVEEGRGPLGQYPVCYANIPLVDVDSPAGAPGEILVTQYLDHLESDPNLPVAVELLALVVRRPTVLHCAGGKDRTGVVTALLLGMLGVTEQAVVDDFLITAQNMDRIVQRFSRWPRYRANMAKYPPETYRAEESTIRTFVREVSRRYGGAREWALGKGLSPDVIAQLEEALLED